MESCNLCKQTLSNVVGESVMCSGLCKSVICRSCAGISKAGVKLVTEISSIHFFCNLCDNFSIKSVADALTEVKSSLIKLSDSVAVGFMGIHSRTAVGAPATPLAVPINMGAGASSALKRRRVDRSANPLILSQPNMVIGSCETLNLNLQTVEQRRCVVASLWHPSTKADDLAKHLRQTLELPENDTSLRCTLLIPAGRKIEELDYISFKIGIPSSRFQSLLSPTIWPIGVSVREFVHKPRTRPFGQLPMSTNMTPEPTTDA